MNKIIAGILTPSIAVGVLGAMITFPGLAAAPAAPGLIPLPAKMTVEPGTFTLRAKTRVLADEASRETAQYLADRLWPATGYQLKVGPASESAKGNIILTTRDAKAALGEEGYELTVTKDAVTIRAPSQAGLFYGVQTLLQLLPPQVYAASAVSGVTWTVPCAQIEDQPRFKWRGLMLDVARHFYSKEEIKQLLDSMAVQKLNTFHWHLVDDQGWRIEIKHYPLLTQIGAWRKSIGFGLDPKSSTAYGPDGRYGGFYTQADIREVIAYAAARHITIVPEIEMPGHSTAALSAYPEFSCSGRPRSTDLNGGVFAGVYCAGNDQTFEFLQNILGEVIDLFPSKYIHIGGDEVPKGNWQKCAKCQAREAAEKLPGEKELQSYFIRRIEKYINSRGRNLLGWSEIREGGLAKNAAVMDWIGGAVEAATDGHDVVMSPTSNCYFDYYQSTNHTTEPKAIGGFLPLKKVYALDPIPAKLDPQFASHILGAQGNLWTEYVASFKHAQYMIYPRLCAIADLAWAPKTGRDFNEFTERLQTQFQRFDQMGVNYRHEAPPAK